MMRVQVKDAIVAFQVALAKLKALDTEQPVSGGFDQGGYSDCAYPLKHLSFSINTPSEGELEWMEKEGIVPSVSITANFHPER